MGFGERLAARVQAVGAPACVGLDPHLDRLPPSLVRGAGRQALGAAASAFCRGVIDVVAPLAAAVKPQVAFFEALGAPGVQALEEVCAAARDAGLVVILDAKRGDIGSTARAYARATLDDAGPLGADAVTLSPWLGPESLEPFLSYCGEGKGIFVLVRTSNPGAGAWQRPVVPSLTEWIAATNRALGGDPGPVGAVVGATIGSEAADLRAALPGAWMLVPGYGAQGAGVEEVRGHLRPDGTGALVVSARGVLFPSSGADGADWQRAVQARARAFVQDLDVLRAGGSPRG